MAAAFRVDSSLRNFRRTTIEWFFVLPSMMARDTGLQPVALRVIVTQIREKGMPRAGNGAVSTLFPAGRLAFQSAALTLGCVTDGGSLAGNVSASSKSSCLSRCPPVDETADAWLGPRIENSKRAVMTRTGQKTAFAFAGGGSLGAIQVGMLRVLLSAGVQPDFVVGASVGAMNAAVVLSKGPAIDAILASAAIPVIFPHVRIDGQTLMDGAVARNSPIRMAADLGASRIVVLPTGYACALKELPKGAICGMAS